MSEPKPMTVGCLVWREIEDRRFVAIIPILFGRARLVVAASIDADAYDDVW